MIPIEYLQRPMTFPGGKNCYRCALCKSVFWCLHRLGYSPLAEQCCYLGVIADIAWKAQLTLEHISQKQKHIFIAFLWQCRHLKMLRMGRLSCCSSTAATHQRSQTLHGIPQMTGSLPLWQRTISSRSAPTQCSALASSSQFQLSLRCGLIVTGQSPTERSAAHLDGPSTPRGPSAWLMLLSWLAC